MLKGRDLLIFLSSLNFSSENALKIYNYLSDNEIDFSEFNSVDFVNEKILTKRSNDKLQEMHSKVYEVLENVRKDTLNKEINILTILDDKYPTSLRYIEDPPSVLYIKGDLKLENPIAFVGARKHTIYGENVVNRIIDDLKGYNFTIVSGMAYGIDALSHMRALKNDLNTVAVLGTGVDYIYPKRNRNLYHEILEKGGAIVSEFSLGHGPNTYTFPMRNRIISGLSDAVVVVEAKDKSGSLITARLAAEQGKEILSVPGNINSLYSVGTNKLIRDGAYPLIEAQDILDLYPNVQLNSSNKSEVSLEAEELVVFNLIKDGFTNPNDISNKLNKDIVYVNKILTMLELKEAIERFSMNEFRTLF